MSFFLRTFKSPVSFKQYIYKAVEADDDAEMPPDDEMPFVGCAFIDKKKTTCFVLLESVLRDKKRNKQLVDIIRQDVEKNFPKTIKSFIAYDSLEGVMYYKSDLPPPLREEDPE